jgi:hypothetical protein
MKLRSAGKYLIRHSPIGKSLSVVAHSTFKNRPIEQWPGWVGTLIGIRVPRRMVPHPTPQPIGGANINIILELLRQTMNVPGDIAECGVFEGETLIPLSCYLREHKSDKKIFGMDSYEGFDDAVNIDIKLGGQNQIDKKIGGFNQTSLEYVQGKVDLFELGDRVKLIKGFFKNSLVNIQDHKFSFVHLDCDIYQSYKECMEFFYSRMAKGGVILFDEYNDPPWPGCNKAIDEFLADKPERPLPIQKDNFIKYYIQKA